VIVLGIGCSSFHDPSAAILVDSENGVRAWLNYCQHYTHIKIDKGSGAEMRGRGEHDRSATAVEFR